MNHKDFTISDLGEFGPVFDKIVAEYKLDDKKDQIFEHLKDVLFGKIKDVDLALILGKELKLNFATYSGLVYKLKKEIIDKKFEIDAFRGDLVSKYWTKDNPNIIAQEIEAKLKLKFETKPLQHRFYQAVLSWIKGIRDNNELEDILTKETKVGGLELTQEIAERVVDFLQQKKEEITKEQIDLANVILTKEAELEAEDGAPEPEEKEIDIDRGPIRKEFKPQENLTGDDITIDKLLALKGVKKEDVSKASEEAQSLAQKIEAKEDFLESREELAPPSPGIKAQTEAPIKPMPAEDLNKEEPKDVPSLQTDDKKTEEAAILAQIKQEEDLPEPQLPKKKEMISEEQPEHPTMMKPQPKIEPPRPEINQPLINKQTEPASQRPKMNDVKFSPQLYGPIDELASFKITDLRRLSKDPNEAINKITAKLDLLEDESIAKRVEGIKALKMSPLYKMYSEIMNKAISQGKSFNQIIESDPIMTMAEFKAIMSLNKQLQY